MAPSGKYLMPAEWERHEATWLAWPKDPLTFPSEILERVEAIYSQMAMFLGRGERVDLLVDDEKARRRVSRILGGRTNVSLHKIRTADVWMRDYGPIFVREGGGGLVATKWIFNAWGNKYDELKPDNSSGGKVAELTDLPVVRPRFVLEGGSIDTNGRGTCITTEQCLLNKNRNPKYDRAGIEGVLRRYLGFSNVVWLKRGITGDDTDGHVDDLARFVGQRDVICMVEEDRRDENYEPLKENIEALRSARDERGRELRVIPISMPRKKIGGDERLPASYANFYVGNGAVLVPTFDDVNDGAAIKTISRFFPGREVVGINCEALVYGFGGIHCVTQQQPAA
ncbi:MAG: agmatine deiminase family protein [Thaumarchaeota archaeon]|nr:agmatine deiminase family protein [Nitrososphaerota archaeon]